LLVKISKWATIILSIFWILFIGLDYWANHSIYVASFEYSQFWGLLLALIGISGGLSFAITRIQKKNQTPLLFSGIGIYLLTICLMFVAIGAQANQIEIPLLDVAAFLKFG